MSSTARRAVIFCHRWFGVAACSLFLLWFPTGIVMMYWGFPGVSASDRLAHGAALDASAIRVTPQDALERAQIDRPPTDVRLNTVDGRPAYRFRIGPDETIVYADTGEPRDTISRAMMDRAASAWKGQPVAAARASCWTMLIGRPFKLQATPERSGSIRGRTEKRRAIRTPSERSQNLA